MMTFSLCLGEINKSSSLIIRAPRAPAAYLLSSLITWLASQAFAFADASSDEIFANGFQAVGYAIPLASPDGADILYTAQVTIGDQNFAMDIDTASTTLAVAGVGCTSGCTGISPLYTASTAIPTGHTASSTYGDGSGWSGPIFQNGVGLGDGSPTVLLDLVKITKATSFFDANNDYQGILGLGSPNLALPHTSGYIPVAVDAGLDAIFAFDLCDSTGPNAGTMWLGGDGSPVSVQYTPLLPSNPFYAIDVDALSLGSTSIVSNASSTFNQPIIDTGTSLFYVPTSVYNAFETTLVGSPEFQAVFGSNTFSTDGCVTDASVSDAQVESDLPPIVLSLPNAASGLPDVTIQAPALNTYLYKSGGGQYCLAIQDGGNAFSLFGVAFMQAFHIVIDLSGGRVGFAQPTSCVAPAVRPIRHPAKNGPHRPPRLVLR